MHGALIQCTQNGLGTPLCSLPTHLRRGLMLPPPLTDEPEGLKDLLDILQPMQGVRLVNIFWLAAATSHPSRPGDTWQLSVF